MDPQITFRQAAQADYSNLAKFLAYEYFVHRHLDWRSTLDWLSHQPFWIAESMGEIVASYAAPPEPDSVAWVRLFACSVELSRKRMWQECFQRTLHQYRPKVNLIAALGIENWFVNLIDQTNFERFQDVIVMEWATDSLVEVSPQENVTIRQMVSADLNEVSTLDAQCFSPLWQLSLPAMKAAFQQSGYATVAIFEGNIIAYQIATESLSSAHLARLAVAPGLRGRNIGLFILNDLIHHFNRKGISHLTVNTQHDNYASQHLYRKAGFISTGERYPVFVHHLNKDQ